MKILIAAGGSGGHIFPAIALARKLRTGSAEADMLFIGGNKELDRRIFEKEGFNFSLLSGNKLPYRATAGYVLFFIKLLIDVAKTFFIMVSYRPGAVVGFGGYASFPAVLIASVLGIPRLVHEQNVVPGRANRVLFKLADKVAVSFEETKNFIPAAEKRKAVFTGNPIRSEIFTGDRNAAERFGLDRSKFTILLIGGSQGAHSLNEAFIKAMSEISKDVRASLQIIHITGLKDYEWALKAYEGLDGLECRVHSFIDRIEEAYSASDLIITRAGASAIFEIASLGKPMILVPYLFAMSHQAENARVFHENGAAVVINEDGLSWQAFRDNILNLANDKLRLRELGEAARRLSVPEAAVNLAREVLMLDKSHETG